MGTIIIPAKTGFFRIEISEDKNWKNLNRYEIIYYEDTEAGIRISEFKSFTELKAYIAEMRKIVEEVERWK